MLKSKLSIAFMAGLACAALPAFSEEAPPHADGTVRATAILAIEGVPKNSTGALSIQDKTIVFHAENGPAARIPLASIQGVFLSQEDKEMGGAPAAVGRAAVPFGGGRVLGALAHKKYDFLTLEYLDSDGGVHGAICQLDKAQGQNFGKDLESKGVRVVGLTADAAKDNMESKNESK